MFTKLRRILGSWQALVIVSVVLLGAFLWWVTPRSTTTGWDTRHWQAFNIFINRVWGQVLVLALMTAGLGLLMWYGRRWLLRMGMAVYLCYVAALAIHALFVLSMAYIHISTTIVSEFKQMQEMASAPAISGGSQSQAPYEKVADPRAVDGAAPELARQVTTPPSAPAVPEAPMPTAPADVAHALPPDRVQDMSSRDEPPLRPLPDPSHRASVDPKIAQPKLVEQEPPPAAPSGDGSKLPPLANPVDVTQDRPASNQPNPNLRPVHQNNVVSPGRPSTLEPNLAGTEPPKLQPLPPPAAPRQPGPTASPARLPENPDPPAPASGAASARRAADPKPTEDVGAPGTIPRAATTGPMPERTSLPAPVARTELIPFHAQPGIGGLGDRLGDAPPKVQGLPDALPRRFAPPGQSPSLLERIPPEEIFGLRKPENQPKAVEQFGGTAESEKAVERGLEWLAAHQGPDGGWSLAHFQDNCQDHEACDGAGTAKSDAAATALALLPFLGKGYTHQAAGKYQQTVDRGLKKLIARQKKDGLLEPTDPQPMYGHGLAAIALCEAYAMTRDPALKDPAQRAIDFIVKSQHPTTGGWRYKPGDTGDTSVFGWQVMALKSGEAAGLTVPATTWQDAKHWLASVEERPLNGKFGYQPGRQPIETMTAEGLLALQLMGTRPDDPRIQSGADYLLQHLPAGGKLTSYYWYYGTQVMFHLQDKHWKTWNSNLRDLLVKTQRTQGGLAGSWDPVDNWEKAGGRIYSTSLRLLMLEVYYRHLPLYRQLAN